MSHILVTGSTGFLGTEVTEMLMRTTQHSVYALVRGTSADDAMRTLEHLWWERPDLKSELGKRIIPVVGDITCEDLGLSDTIKNELIERTEYIIHCAANVEITRSKEHLRKINVDGTQHVLDFACRIQEHHPLKCLSHVSTAYVSGLRRGLIAEDSLMDEGFGSRYEESKFEGEKLVRGFMERIPISIFRPGQIVGNSQTGMVKTFNTLYYPLKLYLKGQLPIMPISGKMKVNLVPVDYVANAIVRITCERPANGKTFHLTAPKAMQPTVAELLNAVRLWAKQELRVNLRAPLFLPLPGIGRLGTWYNHSTLRSGKSVLNNMLALTPYFNEQSTFDTTNTRQCLGEYTLQWQQFLPNLLAYAARKNFLNHNGRTVFEQMLVRLKSRRAPITYYDVAADGTHSHSGEEVGMRIRQAQNSLHTLGIGHGDRVAITGINSVEYFVLDAAIGLSGACSVPLYYTTPPAELDELLRKSGARWLFVGDNRIMSQIHQVKSDIRIVSFVRGNDLPADPRLMTQEQFNELGGREETNAPSSPVGYGDTATIRFTSGTTSDSKGVRFNHYQLRWMVETLGSLLSWKSRNSHVSYLSFLPMSHVVEGILGAYTPYYVLAPVSVYYLNDFSQLVQTLPKVRPTIFFSVPRFYEKVWGQFATSAAGKFYISTTPGLLRTMLRSLMRHGLLRKAGLDKCDQLIVGSAPVSPQLLSDFRELGVEIHNAYGLTEAPLITLNRLGDNELTNTGTPLPDTTVTLADDGEILVQGPQVSMGYDALENETLSGDGLLRTGDLGAITETGHLEIVGRKKEILITAYGKNINIQKVETRIHDIAGVSDVMLVGENRPYCVALIWLEDGNNQLSLKDLHQAIATVNSNLSNPEKIKRWAVMAEPLRISAGELTPNLKLRRTNIMANHAATVEGLYENEPTTKGKALYVGAI